MKNIEKATMELHKRAYVVDTHCDTLLKVDYSRRPTYRKMFKIEEKVQLANRNPQIHLDFPGMREGGVDLQFFAAYIEPQFKPHGSLKRAIQLFDNFYEQLDANPDVKFIKSFADIEEAQRNGQLAALLAIEGGEAIEGDLAVLRVLHTLGVRSIGLTWNERNDIAEGVGDCESGGGLTGFGKDVIREMNRLGMVVDVSHLSEPGFWDVIKVSKNPIIASHSNAKAVCDHVRNLSDEQIKALADNGGVMGMNYARFFVGSGKEVTVDTLLDHIDHIVKLVGPDYVGLGSDFDGIGAAPDGLDNVTKVPLITEGLIKRGYSEENILKILGENHLRVLKTVIK